MNTFKRINPLALLAVLLFCSACSGGSGSGHDPVPVPQSPALQVMVDAMPELPADGVQPWEQLDGSGHVRVTASINEQSEITAGVERFLESGEVSDNGEASRLDANNGLAWAMYRVPMGEAQPGVISVDANLLAGGTEYYVGVSNYKRGRWEWDGPFMDGRIRLQALADEAGQFTSALGNTFVTVMLDRGRLDIVSIGVNQFDPSDTVSPPVVTGLTATAVQGALELSWDPLGIPDLAGYAVYYSDHSFISEDSAGVERVNHIEGASRHMLAAEGRTWFTVRALDFAGNHGPASPVQSAVPLSGEPLGITVLTDSTGVLLNGNVQLSLGGADSYDLDLNGDGVFEQTGFSGDSVSVDTSQTGLLRPAVRGRSLDGERSALGAVSLFVLGNSRPLAVAMASPQGGYAPLTTDLVGSGEDPEDSAGQLSYSWDIDNDGIYGDTADTATVEDVEFAGAGLYSIRLRVTDSGGLSDVDSTAVQVLANQPPHAVLKIDRPVADVPFQFSLNGNESYDPEGGPLSFDLVVISSTGNLFFQLPTGSFNVPVVEPGIYFAALTVTDEHGAQDIATVDFRGRGWIQTEVSPEQDIGVACSLAVLFGVPVIASRSNVDFSIVISAVTSGYGTSSLDWQSTTLPYAPSNFFLDIAKEGDLPMICFSDADNALIFARSTDYTGQDSGSWSFVEIDDSGNSGWHAQFGHNGQGLPCIAYYDQAADATRWAYSSSYEGEFGSWSVVNVDSGPVSGLRTLVLDGKPVICQLRSSQLELVHASDSIGLAWGNPLAVGQSGVTRFDMQLVGGKPAILHYRNSVAQLTYMPSITTSGASAADWPYQTLVANAELECALGSVQGHPVALFEADGLGRAQAVICSSQSGIGSQSWDQVTDLDPAASGSFAADTASYWDDLAICYRRQGSNPGLIFGLYVN